MPHSGSIGARAALHSACDVRFVTEIGSLTSTHRLVRARQATEPAAVAVSLS